MIAIVSPSPDVQCKIDLGIGNLAVHGLACSRNLAVEPRRRLAIGLYARCGPGITRIDSPPRRPIGIAEMLANLGLRLIKPHGALEQRDRLGIGTAFILRPSERIDDCRIVGPKQNSLRDQHEASLDVAPMRDQTIAQFVEKRWLFRRQLDGALKQWFRFFPIPGIVIGIGRGGDLR